MRSLLLLPLGGIFLVCSCCLSDLRYDLFRLCFGRLLLNISLAIEAVPENVGDRRISSFGLLDIF
jgi:hypothetical protein